jgi:GNAT superfamily N-acetyltransferase
MKKKIFSVKVASFEDVKLATQWAEEEGWNPGLHDAQLYYQVDTNGFYMGYLGDEPIASISVVKYDDDFGFLGFYIVKPEYRGQGYGYQLWQQALTHLDGCNVGLDGVVDQQNNYKKSGFMLAHRNIRFVRKGGVIESIEQANTDNIKPLSSPEFNNVKKYCAAFFPADRNAFLKDWIKQDNSVALGYLENGSLQGMGVIRQCASGYKIGPLFADSAEIARAIYLTLSGHVSENDDIFLDVPQVNNEAVKLAEQFAMTQCFETARMYTRTEPDIQLQRTFGITSFEIG